MEAPAAIPVSCLQCGYDLRASDGRCPECGSAFSRAELERRYRAQAMYPRRGAKHLLLTSTLAALLVLTFLILEKRTLLPFRWMALIVVPWLILHQALRVACAFSVAQLDPGTGRHQPRGTLFILKTTAVLCIVQALAGSVIAGGLVGTVLLARLALRG